jgi:HSP20 family molecular chaperone IbpA
VALPTRVAEDKAEASFDNGILKIAMPKQEEKKAIKVNVSLKDKN